MSSWSSSNRVATKREDAATTAASAESWEQKLVDRWRWRQRQAADYDSLLCDGHTVVKATATLHLMVLCTNYRRIPLVVRLVGKAQPHPFTPDWPIDPFASFILASPVRPFRSSPTGIGIGAQPNPVGFSPLWLEEIASSRPLKTNEIELGIRSCLTNWSTNSSSLSYVLAIIGMLPMQSNQGANMSFEHGRSSNNNNN